MRLDLKRFHERAASYHSERIALRPFAPADAWPLWHATREPMFNKHLLWTTPETPAELYGRVRAIIAAAASGRMAAISAVEKDSGRWVALLRAHAQPGAAEPTVVSGIWTHPRFWSDGYSTEATRLAVDACVQEIAPARIVAQAMAQNLPAQKVILGAGFRRCGPCRLVLEDGCEREAIEFEVRSDAHEPRYRELAAYLSD